MTGGFVYPVPRLPDGRAPKISSGFGMRGEGAKRRMHKGVDIMYPRTAVDAGPPGASRLPSHSPKHFMPSGLPALAIAPGVVRISKEIGTGGYVVIDHAGELASQYMHLFNRRVTVGQTVKANTVLGDIGFNPIGYKLIHLHFQMRQNGELLDPREPLSSMSVVDAPGSNSLLIGAVASVAVGLAAAKFIFR